MSWLSLYNSWGILIILVSLFFWNLGGVLLFVVYLILSLIYLLKEVGFSVRHYSSSFWLFILTEVIAFFSLFTTCLWYEAYSGGSISAFIELPFLGCFILIGSSILITAYHHSLGYNYSSILLLSTILLGACFIVLQLYEFYDCDCSLLYSVYYAAAFCTVGLHFSHVLIGLIVLSVVLYLGSYAVSQYYVDLAVWYWHFVDYIWLLVYIVVYLS
nr:cytochrome c oxidase subunit III [Holostephanus sp. FJ-2023]